jgi:fatty acid desaturase
MPDQSYEPFRRSLLQRDELAELSRLRPRIAVRDTLLLWAQIIAAWCVAAAYPGVWMDLAAACFVGNRYYALFILGHDGLHRRLHPSPAVNDWWNDAALIGPLGAVTRLNRRNHMKHHAGLCTAPDPDLYKYRSRTALSVADYLASLSGLTFVARAVRNVYAADAEATTRAATERHGVRDATILLLWQAVLILTLTRLFGWWGYVGMWLLPVYVFTYAADIVRVFCEHSTADGADECPLPARLTTFTSNWFERKLFAPMNMNHHVAHHLWPSIPYYNLPQATALLHARVRAAGGAGPSRRGSYVAYLWRYGASVAASRRRCNA